MKIVRVELFHVDLRNTPPRHQLFIVAVYSDEGLVGAGEMAMPYGVGGEALLGAARAIAGRFVLGADPCRPEAIWQAAFRGSYWGLGHSLSLYAAMSAFDIACWDITAQSLGVPLYTLFGGRVRDRLELYANHWYGDAFTPEEFADRAAKTVAQGWRGLKFDPFREHAGRTQAAVVRLDPAVARRGIARACAVREAVGPDVRLYFDLHGALSAADAIRWCPALAELDPIFLEEPTETLHFGATEQIRRALPRVPLAGGERLYLRQHFLTYFERRLFDVVQPDVCMAGGITETRKILAMAEAYQILAQLHNCAGPVCTAATVHVMAACPNAADQEWFPFWEDGRYAIVQDAYDLKASGGSFDLGLAARPGLGIRLNEEFLARYRVESCTIS